MSEMYEYWNAISTLRNYGNGIEFGESRIKTMEFNMAWSCVHGLYGMPVYAFHFVVSVLFSEM